MCVCVYVYMYIRMFIKVVSLRRIRNSALTLGVSYVMFVYICMFIYIYVYTIKQYICCDNCFSEYKIDTSSDRRFNIAVSRNKSTLLLLKNDN